MPTVDDYRIAAPFTLEEFVNAANSILRDRPTLLVSRRTVRYYIQEGLLPPPKGGPKFARYTIEQLEAIVKIRELVDQGHSLDSIRNELAATQTPQDFALIPPEVAQPSPPPQSPPRPNMPRSDPRNGVTVRRFQLSAHLVVEVSEGYNPQRELSRALHELRKIY